MRDSAKHLSDVIDLSNWQHYTVQLVGQLASLSTDGAAWRDQQNPPAIVRAQLQQMGVLCSDHPLLSSIGRLVSATMSEVLQPLMHELIPDTVAVAAGGRSVPGTSCLAEYAAAAAAASPEFGQLQQQLFALAEQLVSGLSARQSGRQQLSVHATFPAGTACHSDWIADPDQVLPGLMGDQSAVVQSGAPVASEPVFDWSSEDGLSSGSSTICADSEPSLSGTPVDSAEQTPTAVSAAEAAVEDCCSAVAVMTGGDGGGGFCCDDSLSTAAAATSPLHLVDMLDRAGVDCWMNADALTRAATTLGASLLRQQLDTVCQCLRTLLVATVTGGMTARLWQLLRPALLECLGHQSAPVAELSLQVVWRLLTLDDTGGEFFVRAAYLGLLEWLSLVFVSRRDSDRCAGDADTDSLSSDRQLSTRAVRVLGAVNAFQLRVPGVLVRFSDEVIGELVDNTVDLLSVGVDIGDGGGAEWRHSPLLRLVATVDPTARWFSCFMLADCTRARTLTALRQSPQLLAAATATVLARWRECGLPADTAPPGRVSPSELVTAEACHCHCSHLLIGVCCYTSAIQWLFPLSPPGGVTELSAEQLVAASVQHAVLHEDPLLAEAVLSALERSDCFAALCRQRAVVHSVVQCCMVAPGVRRATAVSHCFVARLMARLAQHWPADQCWTLAVDVGGGGGGAGGDDRPDGGYTLISALVSLTAHVLIHTDSDSFQCRQQVAALLSGALTQLTSASRANADAMCRKAAAPLAAIELQLARGHSASDRQQSVHWLLPWLTVLACHHHHRSSQSPVSSPVPSPTPLTATLLFVLDWLRRQLLAAAEDQPPAALFSAVLPCSVRLASVPLGGLHRADTATTLWRLVLSAMTQSRSSRAPSQPLSLPLIRTGRRLRLHWLMAASLSLNLCGRDNCDDRHRWLQLLCSATPAAPSAADHSAAETCGWPERRGPLWLLMLHCVAAARLDVRLVLRSVWCDGTGSGGTPAAGGSGCRQQHRFAVVDDECAVMERRVRQLYSACVHPPPPQSHTQSLMLAATMAGVAGMSLVAEPTAKAPARRGYSGSGSGGVLASTSTATSDLPRQLCCSTTSSSRHRLEACTARLCQFLSDCRRRVEGGAAGGEWLAACRQLLRARLLAERAVARLTCGAQDKCSAAPSRRSGCGGVDRADQRLMALLIDRVASQLAAAELGGAAAGAGLPSAARQSASRHSEPTFISAAAVAFTLQYARECGGVLCTAAAAAPLASAGRSTGRWHSALATLLRHTWRRFYATDHGDFVPWASAILFLLYDGDARRCRRLVNMVAPTPSGRVLWLGARCRGPLRGSCLLQVLLQWTERLLERELPAVHAALSLAMVSVDCVCGRWLAQAYFCVLHWSETVRYFVYVCVLGPDYAVYFTLAVLRHLQPVLRRICRHPFPLFSLTNCSLLDFRSLHHFRFMDKLSNSYGAEILADLQE